MPRAGLAEGRGSGEVVRKVGERAAGTPVGALERFADPEMQLGSPYACEPVVERSSNELVREPVGQSGRVQLLDHPAAHGLVERRQEVGLAEAGGAAEQAELELGSGRGGELEQVAGCGREPRQPLAHDLANALGRAQLGQRPAEPDRALDDLDGSRLDQLSPQLADEERIALGDLADRVGEVA